MYAACCKTAYCAVLQKDMEQMKAYMQRGGFAGGCHLLGRGIGYGMDLRRRMAVIVARIRMRVDNLDAVNGVDVHKHRRACLEHYEEYKQEQRYLYA